MQLIRVALVLAIGGGTAHAFPTGDQFDADPVTMDGAGGIPFDGAPRWQGHTCDVCHTNPPGLIGLSLEADHPELFTAGWQPAMQYHLRVVLENEHEGLQYKAAGDNCGPTMMPYVPCDQNGFALELDDVNGKPTGTLALYINNVCVPATPVPIDPPVRVLTDGSAVTHEGLHYGLTSWDLCWTAPASGTGTITAYLAGVDGNGGDGTINFPNDTTGDDVASGAVPIPEAGATTPPAQTGGCNAAGDAAACARDRDLRDRPRDASPACRHRDHARRRRARRLRARSPAAARDARAQEHEIRARSRGGRARSAHAGIT